MSKVPIEIDQYDTMKKRCFNFSILQMGRKKPVRHSFFHLFSEPKNKFRIKLSSSMIRRLTTFFAFVCITIAPHLSKGVSLSAKSYNSQKQFVGNSNLILVV